MNPIDNSEFVAPEVISLPGLAEAEHLGGLDKTRHELSKAAHTVGGLVMSFFREAGEQIGEGRSLGEKIKIGSIVGGVALTAVAGQLADRYRLPESLNIPNAIETAQDHGNLAGATALGLGVYAAQGTIGAAWGLGLNRFRKTAGVFDEAYPGYKATLAEENAGYLKTLWRHSVIGLGIGNTAFVAADVINDPEMSNFGVLKTSNRSAKRIGAAAMGLGYGILTAAEANYDRYFLWWSVPDVVDRLEKASTWVALGVGVEVLSRLGGAAYNKVKSMIGHTSKEESIEPQKVSADNALRSITELE